MSKYIKADTLIQTLRETIDEHKDSEMFTKTVRAAENMIRIIDQMTADDVVNIVRCKECKYQGSHWCEWATCDDWCSYGDDKNE